MAHQPITAVGETLASVLARQARREPRRAFLIDGDEPITYAQIDEESRRLARALQALGVRAGDRVAIWLPNGSAWLSCFFACVRLRAIVVALNTRFRGAEIGDAINRTGAKMLIFEPRFGDVDLQKMLADVDPESLAQIETVVICGQERTAGLPEVVASRNVRTYSDLVGAAPLDEEFGTAESGCILFTTSGTTRAPKFVLHSQLALLRHGHDVATHFGLQTPGSTLLMTLPFAGIFGFCQATAALTAGATMVTSAVFSADEGMRAIPAHGVTHIVAADVTIDRLLEAASGAQPFAGVRFCVYAIFTPSLADIGSRAEARGLKLVGVYGSSEVQALFARQMESATLEERIEKGGWPVSEQAHVRVRDMESGQPLAHGERGALEIKGPSLMMGYFQNREATQEAMTDDGYFRTGDLGFTCPDGRFVFLARLDDSLRLGGTLVNPAEIEAVVQEHDSVEECQIVGVEAHGQWRAFAFVIASPGCSVIEAEVIDHCKRRLAKSKVPVRVQQIEAFPTTASANSTKIQKGKLRKLAQDVLGQSG